MSSRQLWCKYQRGPWTHQSSIQLLVGRKREVLQPLRGSVVPKLGPGRGTWRTGAEGAACMSHMWLQYVQHVFTHQSTSWQTTRYRSFQLTVNALPRTFFSPLPSWFCLVSLPSPLTVKQARPPGRCRYRSKQLLRDILSRRGRRVVVRQEIRRHVIRGKSWYPDSSFALSPRGTEKGQQKRLLGCVGGWRQSHGTIVTGATWTGLQLLAIFTGHYTTLWGTLVSLSPWLLSFTGCNTRSILLKVKQILWVLLPGNTLSLSPRLKDA